MTDRPEQEVEGLAEQLESHSNYETLPVHAWQNWVSRDLKNAADAPHTLTAERDRLEAEVERLREAVEGFRDMAEREGAIRQEALRKLAEADKAIERYKADNDRMGWILDNGATLESFDGDGTWAVYVPRVVGPDVEWERVSGGHTPRQAIDAARALEPETEG